MSLGCAGAGGGAAALHPETSTPAPAAVETAPHPVAPTPTTDAAPPPAAPGDHLQAVAVPIAGSDFVRGRTTLKVNAPIERVREAVLDFGRYTEFMPFFRGSRVLGRTAAGARDVYMEIEALHGAVRLWVEIEIPRPTIVDGLETYESRFVKGNVKEFKAIWRLRKIDDAATELSLEVFLQPLMSLPTALVNRGNVGGSMKGATAMRARIEGAAEAK
jgi:ribosome-associated toxin RatA of RatAB toxin-antitoxin module